MLRDGEPENLRAAFDPLLTDDARPSSAARLRLRRAVAAPPRLSPAPLAGLHIVRALRACTAPLAAAAALASSSPPCAAAATALLPPAAPGAYADPVPPNSAAAATACAGGCVPALRDALGAGLAECARRWALVPILPGDISHGLAGDVTVAGAGTGDETAVGAGAGLEPVPVLLNHSGVVQARSRPARAPRDTVHMLRFEPTAFSKAVVRTRVIPKTVT